MYFSAKEILAQLDGTDMRICDLVIKNETEISEISREEIFSMLEERYQIMYNSGKRNPFSERTDRWQRKENVGILQKRLQHL